MTWVLGALPGPGGWRGHPRFRVVVNARSLAHQERIALCYRDPGVWSGCMILTKGTSGVIFSARKRPRKGVRTGASLKKGGQEDPKRRKVGGVFRHTLSSLKKVARLPVKDRGEVLKVLKKNERRRRVGSGAPRSGGASDQVSANVSSSSASANDDWQHWVVM
ncbi:DUF4283 domain protein [Trifolium medium]|uniref:DUF4283 domain protein n=1 Tax=Trifolium medium TaxID=97028 RepID=A0A392PSV5_9FABA|nr:DUF4283 domain protein [Trifolium medium]